MLSNLKLIFIHGVNDQTTNYSHGLCEKILSSCRSKLKERYLEDYLIEQILNRVVHHEVMWADLTTDLTNRYLQLQYQEPSFPWGLFTKKIDPLAMQIMQYIKDKGDKETGPMNILREVDEDMQKIFFQTNIGDFVYGQDKNAVIVAHSLGSVIAFDYVFCFRDKCRLDKDVTIKAFITLGSPIPLFTSAMGHPDSDLTLPPNVKKWVNILSRKDGVARRHKPFFKNIPIEEHEVNTGFFPIRAHAGYWNNRGTASLIADEVLEALELNKRTSVGAVLPTFSETFNQKDT